MSTGAVFKLIANDGKADRLIMATALLNQRIKDVMCARAAAGKEDSTPTLVDLEHTHILYVNAHFKPYAAIGFEYNKVLSTAGTVALGTRLTFNIPQFGDFFHDMVLRTRISTVTGTAGPLPAAGSPYIPATNLPGVNASHGGNGEFALSTGATQYAVAAASSVLLSQATVVQGVTYPHSSFGNTNGANPTQINGSDTPANYLTAWLAIYAALGLAVYDQVIADGTRALIYAQTQVYWTANTYSTIFANTVNNTNAAIISTFNLVNAMFAIALSATNPAFRLNMSQATYNQIALGCVFGIFQGMVQSAIVGNPLTTTTVGNQYFTFLTYVFTQTYGTPWTVPQYVQYEIVDAFGNYIEASPAPGLTANYVNFVRYCEFPGNRIIRSVRFDVNGNPLDQYSSYASLMLEKFTVPTHKRVGYNRLVGQAVPLTGAGALQQSAVTDPNSATTPAGIARWASTQSNSTVALFSPNGAGNPANLVAGSLIDPAIPTNVSLNQFANQYDVNQQVLSYNNGPQTPKPAQPPLELWHKLRFWFCDDVRQSIPSVAIPFGQRFISVDLAAASDLVFEFPSLYLQRSTTAPVFTISSGTTIVGSQRTVTHSPIQQFFGITPPVLTAAELYINNIFVNPEIHDVYIKRIGFSLIRVYREHSQQVNASGSARELLSQLKWPIEYMFVGLQPSWNTSASNPSQWRDWHRLTYQVNAAAGIATESQVPAVQATYGFAEYPPSATGQDVTNGSIVTVGFRTLNQHLIQNPPPLGVTSPANLAGSRFGQVIPNQYWLNVPTVDSMSLIAHGVTIYDDFQDLFYSGYTPYQYGCANVTTPDDPGAFLVNMALFPRSYQPSGHLNVSRARETYLVWNSSYVGSKSSAQLIVVAIAINFLLISDGSAVLRYST